jgi:hypothetical protein
MSATSWDICPEGQAWSYIVLQARYNLITQKIELIQGKLFWSGEARLNVLGLPL